MRIIINNSLDIFRTLRIFYINSKANVRFISERSCPTQNMSGLLAIFDKNPKRSERIKFLGELFKTNGFELRIAGGAVRDILRGVEPDDIDFATTARPEQTLEIVSKHEDLLRVIITNAGVKHGTVAVKFKEIEIDFKRIKLSLDSDYKKEQPKDREPVYDNENPFEITTLRCDTLTDGRHAEVEFVSDWKIDAERRDLTINSMFLTLDNGELVDFFNGRKDLEDGIVRFVGNADSRIKEDYLRILRFFRFWSRYGRNKRPDDDTLNTIKANLSGFDIISGERIWVELKKIFSHTPCSSVVKLMIELRVFDNIGLSDKDIHKGYLDYHNYINEITKEVEFIEENIKTYRDTSLNQNTSDSHSVSLDKKLKDLIPVILFSSVIRSQEMLHNATNKMKLSNLEKETIMYIVDMRSNCNWTIKSLKHQLATMNPIDRAPKLTLMKAILIYKGLIDWAHELSGWHVPTFPITGVVVSKEFKNRKLPGNKIKNMITELKDAWAESDYQLDEEDLTKLLIDKCDKLKTK